jgi:hypothetical protein
VCSPPLTIGHVKLDDSHKLVDIEEEASSDSIQNERAPKEVVRVGISGHSMTQLGGSSKPLLGCRNLGRLGHGGEEIVQVINGLGYWE